ncbi:TPA: hypothetical protein DDW35_08155 [Candidatus Sumerlaeota bacterium]|nr:hypothetical protein [Candidatus Sumerlaeota bacterium]
MLLFKQEPNHFLQRLGHQAFAPIILRKRIPNVRCVHAASFFIAVRAYRPHHFMISLQHNGPDLILFHKVFQYLQGSFLARVRLPSRMRAYIFIAGIFIKVVQVFHSPGTQDKSFRFQDFHDRPPFPLKLLYPPMNTENFKNDLRIAQIISEQEHCLVGIDEINQWMSCLVLTFPGVLEAQFWASSTPIPPLERIMLSEGFGTENKIPHVFSCIGGGLLPNIEGCFLRRTPHLDAKSRESGMHFDKFWARPLLDYLDMLQDFGGVTRGVSYALNHKVLKFSPNGVGRITALVQGRQPQPYKAVFFLKSEDGTELRKKRQVDPETEELFVDVDCTCPIGGDCKHAYAAVLTLLYAGYSKGSRVLADHPADWIPRDWMDGEGLPVDRIFDELDYLFQPEPEDGDIQLPKPLGSAGGRGASSEFPWWREYLDEKDQQRRLAVLLRVARLRVKTG